MTLNSEIAAGRREIHSDGYPMSIGELINLYRDSELFIRPEFQRYYRWSQTQKSKFIESLLLGIPIPSIFVSQRTDGVWEVVDGLQRLSTIFEFVGVLRDEDQKLYPPLTLVKTRYLPSLENKVWSSDSRDYEGVGTDNQLLIKRSKIDVKIILRESDERSKYELFERLNSGGTPLTNQEFRNSMLVAVNPERYRWLINLSNMESFRTCVALTDRAAEEQYDVELVLRFLVLRKRSESELRELVDINEFLTDKMMDIAESRSYDTEVEQAAFEFSFQHLAEQLGDNSFKRYNVDRYRFMGGFLLSAFEVMAIGLGFNYESYSAKPNFNKNLEEVAISLWTNNDFITRTGSGVRASSRIPYIVPLGRQILAP